MNMHAEKKRGSAMAKDAEMPEAGAFPAIINLNVQRGDCPCRCVHCPVGMTPVSERRTRFAYEHLSLSLYKKVIDEVAANVNDTTIRLHSVGEPLLWKYLPEAARYSHESGVRTWIFTSCVTKDKGLLRKLVRDIDIIEVSVNSTSSKDYMKTKGIDAFRLVCDNISYMSRMIRTSGYASRLIVSRVQSDDKAMDGRFIDYWKSTGLVDDAFVRSYHTYNGLLGEDAAGGLKAGPCRVHWSRFNVNIDGRVIVCFNELFKEYLEPSLILGDLREQSIAEIWQGDRLAAIRKAELCGDYSHISFGDNLPCRNCTSCQPLFCDVPSSEYQIIPRGDGKNER